MNKQSLQIGLLWHSMNSDNLGVGALTLGHIALIREAAARNGQRVRFTVLGWQDPKTPYPTAESVEIRGFRLADFARLRHGFVEAVRGVDVVLDIGAGDSFSDIYGPGRILKMMAAQKLVRLAGRPLVLSPQTIGPFNNKLIEKTALSVMRSATFVASRDDLSTACARDMGFDGPLIEASDVALRLPYQRPPLQQTGIVRVGVNVSGLLFNGGYTQDNMFGLQADYPDLMRAIIGYFNDMPDVEVHLVGHVLSDDNVVEDDHRVARHLAEEFEGACVAPVFKSPSEAKSYIAGLDFFTGSRMHACIAAFSSGVPVAPLAYSRKFEGLFGALGYGASLDCKTLNKDEILSRVRTAFRDRHVLRQGGEAALKEGLKRLHLYEDYLVDLFAAIAPVKAAA